MLIAFIGKVAVDFIGDNDDMVVQAKLSDAGQLFPGKSPHGGVMGIGEEEKLGSGMFQLAFQILKVNLLFSVSVLYQRVGNELAAVVFDNSRKRRVYRGLDDDLIAGIGKGPDGVHKERKHAVGIFHPGRIHVPTKALFLPIRGSFFKFKAFNRIAKAGMLCAFLDCL